MSEDPEVAAAIQREADEQAKGTVDPQENDDLADDASDEKKGEDDTPDADQTETKDGRDDEDADKDRDAPLKSEANDSTTPRRGNRERAPRGGRRNERRGRGGRGGKSQPGMVWKAK